MKKILCLTVGLFTLNLTPVFSQAPPPTRTYQPPNFPRRLPPSSQSNSETLTLTKFNLDFPGGTPAELVTAIEKATGKPLNSIIPDEDANIQLPPLKMSDVDASQLFGALETASVKQTAVGVGTSYFPGRPQPYTTLTGDYGFRTDDHPISDTSIWYFHVDKPVSPPVIAAEKICKFYSLEPYLNRGFTVDDITTAIQTGWKMADITSPPKLDYHKETKLLIAFGEPSELKTIDDVLKALTPPPLPSFRELMDQNAAKQFQAELKKKSTNSPVEKSGK